MRSVRLLTVLAFLSCWPTQATADPLFDRFHTVCIKTDADLRKAFESLDGRAWIKLPAEVLVRLLPEVNSASTMEGRLNKESREIVAIVDQPYATGLEDTVNVRYCVLIGATTNEAAVKSALKEYAGVPPTPSTRLGNSTYVFTSVRGRHYPIPNAQDSKSTIELVKNGVFRMAFARTGPAQTVLGIAVPAE